MSTTKASYATSTAATITLTSLGNGSARESTAIVNTTNLYLDAQLYVACKLVAGTPSGGIDVYLYGSEDGTNYDDNATGTDAAITLRTPCNLVLIGRIQTETAGALTWKMSFKSLAASFGGVLPANGAALFRTRPAWRSTRPATRSPTPGSTRRRS